MEETYNPSGQPETSDIGSDGYKPRYDIVPLVEVEKNSLRHALCLTDHWIAAMNDPEAGAAGLRLQQAVRKSGVGETLDPAMVINAAFNTFVFPPFSDQNGFRNEVTYGMPALTDKSVLLGARCHEYIHALQYQKSVAAHADPFNEATPFFLGPIDYLIRKECLEQDAYVKGAWLQSLAADVYPYLEHALDKTPMPVGLFRDIRAQSSSLKETFQRAADKVSSHEGYWLADGSKGPVRDLWHEIALREYASVLRARKSAEDARDDGGRKFTFVSMDRDDVIEIGTSFGENPFDGRPRQLPQLSPANRKLLESIEREFDIPQRSTMLPIAEALSAEGLTRKEFIAHSKKHTGSLPRVKPRQKRI